MTFDWWDNAQEETQDIASSAGGVVAMLGAAFLAGIVALKRLRERSAADGHRWSRLSLSISQICAADCVFLLTPSQLFTGIDSSPPLPLRI